MADMNRKIPPKMKESLDALDQEASELLKFSK